MRFRILDWDTAFFGMPVARILPSRLTTGELEQILAQMKSERVALAYWASDPNDAESQQAARACHGFLADRKTTFVMELGQSCGAVENFGWTLEEYTETVPNSELEHLAIQAGIYSRFRVDPRIPEDKCADLYRQWIRNSTNRRLADAVLVARRAGKIVGMVTVGEKSGVGDIGLIAADASARGLKLGSALVLAAQEWARRRGLKTAQVISQGANLAACKLYEKCGYRTAKVENLYHFWIS
ncbi:MAG: GNAT family N-acetyltransferase [Verrucomicrobia bacterium]|nr:GNAT family N-acetyltransferase [Verrucomicrobiota bacterium]